MKVSTTWFDPDSVAPDSTDQTELRSRVGYFFSMSNVKRTSAGVSGSPLLNLTPDRIVNVSVRLPLVHAQLVASHGVSLAFCSVLTNTSGSYTGPRE